jgi:hypothetical protein
MQSSCSPLWPPLPVGGESGGAGGVGGADHEPDGDPDSGAGGDDEGTDVHVRVVLRCRPLLLSEEANDHVSVISCTQNDVTADIGVMSASGKHRRRSFNFARVYNEQTTQRALYSEVVAPLVSRALGGYHCAVFAYGQVWHGFCEMK